MALGQLQQVLDRRQQLVVVPWLSQIIGRTGFDKLHGRLQMSPRRQQNHGQIRLRGAQRAEQGRAFVAGRRVCAEVHVGDDEVDLLPGEERQTLLRRCGGERADVVQTEQQPECLGHRRIVIDDEYAAHRMECYRVWNGCHTPRVARAGGIAAARKAGQSTAS